MIYWALHDLAPAYLSNSFLVHFSHTGSLSIPLTSQTVSYLGAFAQDLPSPLPALLLADPY